MKKFLSFIAIVFLTAVSINAQTADQTELVTLQNKLRPLLLKDEYEEIIPIAVKIVELERKGGDTAGFERALRNLAQWRSKRQAVLATQFRFKKPKETQENFTLASENFREVLNIAEQTGDPLKLASAQIDLADFLYSFASTTKEAENLYKQAIANREKKLPADSDEILSVVNNLSWIYFGNADFENFYPLNRRFVLDAEKKYGPNDKRLGPALAAYAIFLAVTDRSAEAEELAARVVAITGDTKFAPKYGRLVQYRSLERLNLNFGKVTVYMNGTSPVYGGPTAPNPFDVRSNATTYVVNGQAYKMPASQTTAGTLPVTYGTGSGGMGNTYVYDKATYAHVSLLIDEDGNVAEVTSDIKDEKIAAKIKERLNYWKFRPLTIDGQRLKMRCTVTARY